MSRRKLFNFRDIAVLLYLFPVRFLAIVLPIETFRRLSSMIGYFYGLLAFGKKRKLEERLATVFGNKRTHEEIKALSTLCLRTSCSIYMDDLVLSNISSQDLLRTVKVDGFENLTDALSHRKGVLLVTGHFSTSSVAPRFLRAMGFSTLEIRKKNAFNDNNSIFKNYCLIPYWVRVITYTEGDDYVFIEDRELSLRILRRLRENGLVIVHLDVPFSQHLVKRDFLGESHDFPVDFLRIVYAAGAAIIPMACWGSVFEPTICFEKLVEPEEASGKDEFISKNIDSLVKILELQVKREPSQWVYMCEV